MIGGLLGRVAASATALGCAIVVFEAFWVSYGVLARYVIGDPDRLVTEGSALILLSLAFAGLPAALREDSFPKVTFLLNALPRRVHAIVNAFNMAIMAFIGCFFAMAAGRATWATFESGQASHITEWKEYLVWLPVAAFTTVFTICAFARLIELVRLAGSLDRGS